MILEDSRNVIRVKITWKSLKSVLYTSQDPNKRFIFSVVLWIGYCMNSWKYLSNNKGLCRLQWLLKSARRQSEDEC